MRAIRLPWRNTSETKEHEMTSVLSSLKSLPAVIAAFIRRSILRMGGNLRGFGVIGVVGHPLPSDALNIGHFRGSGGICVPLRFLVGVVLTFVGFRGRTGLTYITQTHFNRDYHQPSTFTRDTIHNTYILIGISFSTTFSTKLTKTVEKFRNHFLSILFDLVLI